jgi:hypothetical protein
VCSFVGANVSINDFATRPARYETDQQGPFANSYPFTPQTVPTLQRIAALKPKTIALMHGSSFVGNGEQALKDLSVAMRDVLGGNRKKLVP